MVGVILVVYQRYDWIVDRICDASNGGGMGGGVCCVMWGRGLMIVIGYLIVWKSSNLESVKLFNS